MEERTTGLIFRTRPLTETSLIVHWLTRDFGRISTVAKGARRPKSPFSGKLDLFYVADFSFFESRRSELHTLREVSVTDFNASMRSGLGPLQQGSYLVQAVEQTTEMNTPLPGFFDLVLEALQVIGAGPMRPLTVLAFEAKLLTELGLNPGLGYAVSARSREWLERITGAEWPSLAEVSPSSAEVRELDHILKGSFVYHFGRVGSARAAAVSECQAAS